jgi:flagellar biogenesis protein FliO
MRTRRKTTTLAISFFAALLVGVSFAAADVASGPGPAAAPAPGYDPHAGKPILRDDSPTATTNRTAPDAAPTLDLDSGHIALALSGVIGLILLLRYCGTKFFPAAVVPGRPQAVRVLSRCPLAPRQQVLLIQVGKRIVVAGDSGGQLTSLAQITDADEVAALVGEISRAKASPIGRPFKGWFTKAADEFVPDDDGAAFDADAGADTGTDTGELMPTGLDVLAGDDAAAEPADPHSPHIHDLTEKVRRLREKLGSA